MKKRVLAIAAAAGAAMLVLDRRLNLWVDEGYTLETTDHGVRYAVRQAIRYELYPPLYFAALAAWRTIDRSYAFARAFSTLAAALVVVDGTRVLRAYVPEADETAVALALALHPLVVRIGTEARPYAATMWLSARLLGAFRDAYLVTAPRRGARARFVAWAIVAMHTHVYLGFVLAGCGIACALFARPRFGAIVRDAALVAVAIAPLAFALRSPTSEYRANYAAAVAPAAFVRECAAAFASFVLPSEATGRARRPLAALAALALVAIAVRDDASGSTRRVPLTIAAASVATWIAAIVTAKTRPLFPAHATPFAFPTILAAAAVLRTPRRTRAAALASAALGANAARMLVRRGANAGDWIRVARYLEDHAAAGEPIAVFAAESTMPLRRHFRGPNRIVGIPDDVAFDRYDLSRFVVRDGAQLANAFSRMQGAAFWLASPEATWVMSSFFGTDILETYVADRYEIVRDVAFYGTRLRLLAPRASER